MIYRSNTLESGTLENHADFFKIFSLHVKTLIALQTSPPGTIHTSLHIF